MPLARCQAVADTREIIEIKFDLYHVSQQVKAYTKSWTITFLIVKP